MTSSWLNPLREKSLLKTRGDSIRRFAEFAEVVGVGTHERVSLSQVDSLLYGAGAQLWRETVAAYVRRLEKRPVALTAFAEEIGNLFRGLDELASLGLAAKCERPALPKNYHASGRHKPGLVEQSNKAYVAPELLARLQAHIDSLNLPLTGNEANELLKALGAQVPMELLHDEVAVSEAIFRLNAQALVSVRSCAETTFLYWRAVWLKGQALLTSNNISVSIAVRNALKLPKHRSGAPLRALFSTALGDEAVGNFLKLFHEDFGESPRVLRRLFSLRGLSHEEVKQVLA